MVECHYCHKKIPSYNHHYYCSDECKMKAYAERAEWKKKRPRLCKECGKPVPIEYIWDDPHHSKHYCSNKCFIIAYRRRHPERIKKKRMAPKCVWCGKELPMKSIKHVCSEECAKKRAAQQRTCQIWQNKHDPWKIIFKES